MCNTSDQLSWLFENCVSGSLVIFLTDGGLQSLSWLICFRLIAPLEYFHCLWSSCAADSELHGCSSPLIDRPVVLVAHQPVALGRKTHLCKLWWHHEQAASISDDRFLIEHFQCPPCPGILKVSEMSPSTCTLHPAAVWKQWDAQWASSSVVVESNTGPNRLSFPAKDHHAAEMSPRSSILSMSWLFSSD